MGQDVDKSKIGVCDVHRLVDKDTRRRRVSYCSVCEAWICKECWPNLAKRARAMLIKKFRY